MRIRKQLVTGMASAVLAAAALAGCSAAATESPAGEASSAAAVAAAGSAAEVLAANKAAHGSDEDANWDEAEVVDIALSGNSATVSGDEVSVDGATVTVTSGGTYRLRGTLSAGQVVINAPDATVKLILDGADISSPSSAAIAATEAEEVIVILADGSRNTLSDTGSYAQDADVNAALFSAGDLTVTGNGALTVRGNGNDGIASKDGLVIQSGTITVDAVDDGVRGKDYLVIESGTVTVDSGGDGLKADNGEDADSGYIAVMGGTVKVSSSGDGADAATDLVVTGGELEVKTDGGTDSASAKGLKSAIITVLEGGTATVDATDDAVHSDGTILLTGADLTLASGDDAVHADATLRIQSGTVDITRSYEGLEAKDIELSGGTVNIVSSDDGVNAAGGTGQATGRGMPGGGGGGEAVGDYSLTISGGTLVINAGGDGFDSNGTAEITGGTVVVNGPTQNMNGALDVNGSFQISGGVLVAAGSSGMAVAPDEDSPQGWLSATLNSGVAAGSTLHIVDSGGTVVATFVTSKTMQNLVYSDAGIKAGQEYKVYIGGTVTGASTGGLAESGTLGSAQLAATVTAGQAPAGGFGGLPRR